MIEMKFHEPGTEGYAHDMGLRLLRVRVTDVVIWLKAEDERNSIRHIVEVLETLDNGALGDDPKWKNYEPSIRGGNGNVYYDKIYLTLEAAEEGKKQEIAEMRRAWLAT